MNFQAISVGDPFDMPVKAFQNLSITESQLIVFHFRSFPLRSSSKVGSKTTLNLFSGLKSSSTPTTTGESTIPCRPEGGNV